jgi:hypothetical protein
MRGSLLATASAQNPAVVKPGTAGFIAWDFRVFK